jgi:hypothetical protein
MVGHFAFSGRIIPTQGKYICPDAWVKVNDLALKPGIDVVSLGELKGRLGS